ncbi:MAG: DUF2505 domain-containing protein [Propionibacteriaceae bacterium]|nr:DUF2505 domain-containing protein [Propionibacteriaceae bacterium]
MQLSSRQEFPAPPADVFAMLTDEEFLRHAAGRMGATQSRVSATDTTTSMEATLLSPAPVRPFLGPTLMVRLALDWGQAEADGSRSGTFQVTVPGTPVNAQGSTHLAPTASGTEVSYEGDLTVKIPLVGARIEREAAPLITKALNAQARVGREWLAR